MNIFLFIVCVVVSVTCVKLPKNFMRCNRHQPNFDECILKAAQHDIAQMYRLYKKIGLPNGEPLELTKLSSTINANLIKFEEELMNCKFYGITKGEVKRIEFNLKNRFVYANAIFPLIASFCHYRLNDTILAIPVHGIGNSSLRFVNFNMTIYVTYDEIVKNNKTYAKILSCSVDGKPEDLSLQLDNLFNGDEETSGRINKIINENWSELYDDIKNEYLDIPNQMFTSIIGGFLSRVSLEELFD